jgi:hypothetical protein
MDYHREHGDVLGYLRLRLDLEDLALEGLVAISLDGNVGKHVRLDAADVGLVYQSAHLHLAQVGHRHEQRAATHDLGRRGDHVPHLHGPGDDRPGDRRTDRRLRHPLPGGLQNRLRADELRPGVRMLELGLLVVLVADDLLLEHAIGTFELGLGDLEPCPGHLEVGLGLGQPLARVDLIDLNQ